MTGNELLESKDVRRRLLSLFDKRVWIVVRFLMFIFLLNPRFIRARQETVKKCLKNIFFIDSVQWKLDKSDIYTTCDVSNTVIVMSLGENVSDSVLATINGLVDDKRSSSIQQSVYDYGKAVSAKNPVHDLQNIICLREGSLLKGFVWNQFDFDEASLENLLWIAKHNIPVIYITLNPLDIILSDLIYQHEYAQCGSVGTGCIGKEYILSKPITIQPPVIRKRLYEITRLSNYVKSLLNCIRVQYVEVKYEKLLYDHNSEGEVNRTWMKLLEFISPLEHWHKEINRSMLDIPKNTPFYHHRNNIANFEEIYELLRGTRFARFLTPNKL